MLVDESYATLEPTNVRVVLDEDRSATGVTVVDESGSSIRVAESIDTARFERDFLSALAGEDVGPIVVDTDWDATFDGTTWELELPERLASGTYTLHLSNDSPGLVVLVFGWFIEGATLEDLDAWIRPTSSNHPSSRLGRRPSPSGNPMSSPRSNLTDPGATS